MCYIIHYTSKVRHRLVPKVEPTLRPTPANFLKANDEDMRTSLTTNQMRVAMFFKREGKARMFGPQASGGKTAKTYV